MRISLSYRARSFVLAMVVLICVFAIALLLGLSAVTDGRVELFGLSFAFDRVLTLAVFAMSACVFLWTYRQRTIDRAFDVDDMS